MTMNYEQKYKEALERARKINSGEGVATHPDWSVCEVIFPELREVEDERIRKILIELIKGITSWNYFLGISKEQMIAWLEKQGEQKPSWNEEDEKMYNMFRSMAHGTYVIQTQETIDSLLSWLKSLKPQNKWKPSEEQMQALKFCCANFEEFDALKSLYNDLLKL